MKREHVAGGVYRRRMGGRGYIIRSGDERAPTCVISVVLAFCDKIYVVKVFLDHGVT